MTSGSGDDHHQQEHCLLLDAATMIAGIVGRASSPASVVVATIRLGGLAACAPDNALEEARHHLLAHYNADD